MTPAQQQQLRAYTNIVEKAIRDLDLGPDGQFDLTSSGYHHVNICGNLHTTVTLAEISANNEDGVRDLVKARLIDAHVRALEALAPDMHVSFGPLPEVEPTTASEEREYSTLDTMHEIADVMRTMYEVGYVTVQTRIGNPPFIGATVLSGGRTTVILIPSDSIMPRIAGITIKSPEFAERVQDSVRAIISEEIR